ncbi:MAG TPA: extracellular solute-binding protein [Candidatus Binatia bacterium]|jgi:ABC-type Fe3+ transport system substrate-binding protein
MKNFDFVARRFKVLWGFVLILCFAVSAWSQDKAALQKIIEGAKKEGGAKVGLTVRWEENGKPAAKKIVDVFHARYPAVKIEYERVGGSRERERVLTELAAGRVTYDVTAISATQVPISLKASVIEKVDWLSLGIHPKHVHPDGAGVLYRTQLFGITYNRKLIPDEVGQKLTWEDCVDPKWKKKIAMDNRPHYLELLYQPDAWGKEKTLAYARQLGANQTIFERSRSAAMTKLALGEYPIICGAAYPTYKERFLYAGDKHLGFVFPEPVPVPTGEVIFVPRGASRPNAGKLFIVWSLSDEGQKTLDEVEFDGSPLVPGTETAKLLKGKKVVWHDWKIQSRADEILKEILEATGLPIVR